MIVFDRIKLIASRRGLSLKETALKAGLSENAIYSWKNKVPTVESLESVADVLGISVDYLLGREEETSENSAADLIAAHIDENASQQEIQDIIDYIEFKKNKK